MTALAGGVECPPPRPMVACAEHAWRFIGGDLALLPLYAAIHPLDDPERITALLIDLREFIRDQ